MSNMKAFSNALALESIPEELNSVDRNLLLKYARTVAYKTFHNLQHGYPMDPANDPLRVGGAPAALAWPEHYQGR